MQTFGLDAERFGVLSRIEGDHFWFVARRELLTGLMRRYAPKNMQLLLDLGCGPGLNLAHWDAFASQVTGVDQHSALTNPNGVDAKPIVDGDVTQLPFDDDCADFTLLLDVLEHVDDEKALAEAFRVLKPGGGLLLSVPAHPWLWGARDIGADHLRRYSRAGLRQRVQTAGFQITAQRPYQFFLMPLVIASRLIGKATSKTRDMEDRPRGFVNAALKWINRIEVWISLSICAMPTGSSYTLVARKPG